MADPDVYPDYLPPAEDTDQQMIDEYQQELSTNQEQEHGRDGYDDDYLSEPAQPTTVYVSDEELKERRMILNYLAIAKAKFPSIYGALNVDDLTLENADLHTLRKYKVDYQMIRNHRNGYEAFIVVAQNATLIFERLIAPMVGLDLEGFHDVLMKNPEYVECLQHLAHDHAISNLTPIQRLMLIVVATGYQIHTQNTLAKKVKTSAISDNDLNNLGDL